MGTFDVRQSPVSEKKESNSMEFINSLPRIAPTSAAEFREKQEQEEDGDEGLDIASMLKINIPLLSHGEFKDKDEHDQDHDDEEEEGCKTPTSLGHRIPLVPQCPPAPTKPKSSPLTASTKRKAAPSSRRSILLDLSSEVELLFPRPSVLGGKIKKVRLG